MLSVAGPAVKSRGAHKFETGGRLALRPAGIIRIRWLRLGRGIRLEFGGENGDVT